MATLLYDSFRFGFLGFGLMHHDPIPNIGEALHLRPAWVAGYLWRYLGNGTGLALAFFALGLRGIHVGVLYGLFVCGGLLLTLAVSPYGTQMLFPITVWSAVMAIGGHVIFGAASAVSPPAPTLGAPNGSPSPPETWVRGDEAAWVSTESLEGVASTTTRLSTCRRMERPDGQR